MDLNSFESKLADEGFTLELRDPRTAEIIPGMTITLYGPDSEVFEKRRRQKSINSIAIAQKKGRNALKPEELAERNERETLEDLVVLTKGWHSIQTPDAVAEGQEHSPESVPYWVFNGEKLEPTPENIRSIYQNRKLAFIREQVEQCINDRGNWLSTETQT